MKYLKLPLYVLEVLVFSIIYIIGLMTPFKVGSAIGGRLAKYIGPLLPINRTAHTNLKRVFPDLTPQAMQKLIKQMWETLGRTIFEYPRQPTIDPFGPNSPYEIRGIEHLDQMIQDKKPGFLFTAHMGHWGIGNYVAVKRGLKLAHVSRYVNNPLLRNCITFVQERVVQKLIPKGKEGVRNIVSFLREGGHVSMMLDQKLNTGIAVPFFGYDAMTAPAIAKLALRFNCPILPVQVERLEGIKCRITFHPPLEVPSQGTEEEIIYQLMLQVNQHIEQWIRQAPGQWFWLHKRWDKRIYKEAL